MENKFIDATIERTKKIALIAHDRRKPELLEWVEKNKEILQTHFLCGTGTTGSLIQERTDLPVELFYSGPLGGDLQIGAKIADGEIQMMIFLWDPLEPQPHDPDVKALLRIATVFDIPVANNLATADFILHSEFMNKEYHHRVRDHHKTLKKA